MYKYIIEFDLAQHRYLNTRVLVQHLIELFEIAMSMFDYHSLQEIGGTAFLSWATYNNVNDRTSEHLATPVY